ncbi:hypothetical protein PCE1_001200 [Barthelona sp. PCE]
MVLEKFWRFDLFTSSKLDKDVVLKRSTKATALLSVAAVLFCVFLVGSEFGSFLRVDSKTHVTVNKDIGTLLPVHMVVSFPELPCDLLSLDVISSTGHAQIDVHHNIFKEPIDPVTLLPIAEREKLDLKEQKKRKDAAKTVSEQKAESEVVEKDYCGPCYGARPEGECCNTCAEIKQYYRQKNWQLSNLNNYEQCRREGVTTTIKREGCRIDATVQLERVKGNLHISPGHSIHSERGHVHTFDENTLNYNTSHIWHHLSFGKDVPGIKNPLDNYRSIHTAHQSRMDRYFIDIVGTRYTSLKGDTIVTNQYSTTSSSLEVNGLDRSHVPGLYVLYDISPLMIDIQQTKSSFGHFLVSVCAVVGGVLSVLTLIDSVVFSGMRAMRKKARIGKLI